MTTEYIAVPKDLTAQEVIDKIRELEPEAETIYYVYVTDSAEHLVGVISLPSGLFQPYTGVKTSILVLDRNLAKRADSIWFCKVSNIGYSLSVARRPIEEDDLPQAFEDYRRFVEGDWVETAKVTE